VALVNCWCRTTTRGYDTAGNTSCGWTLPTCCCFLKNTLLKFVRVLVHWYPPCTIPMDIYDLRLEIRRALITLLIVSFITQTICDSMATMVLFFRTAEVFRSLSSVSSVSSQQHTSLHLTNEDGDRMNAASNGYLFGPSRRRR
jgi:hypothetical protein